MEFRELEIEELSQVIEHEREDQIKQLEQQLSQAEENATSNKNAADILTDLINKGDVKQEADGSITIVRGPNVIGNKGDVDM